MNNISHKILNTLYNKHLLKSEIYYDIIQNEEKQRLFNECCNISGTLYSGKNNKVPYLTTLAMYSIVDYYSESIDYNNLDGNPFIKNFKNYL